MSPYPQTEERVRTLLNYAVFVLGDVDRSDPEAVDDVVAETEDHLSWATPNRWPYYGVHLLPDGRVEAWAEVGFDTVRMQEVRP